MFSNNRPPRPVLEDLRKVELFNACTDAELRQIDRLAITQDVEAGEVLCREGRIGRQAFVIVKGEATVTIGGVEVARLGPGNFFGEMAILDRAPRLGTVTAATTMTVLVFSVTELTSLVRLPGVASRMLATLTRRLRAADHSYAEARA